jgi:hypothetical protein
LINGASFYSASGTCGGGSCSSGTYYDSTTCSAINDYNQYAVSSPVTKYTGSGTCASNGTGNCYKLANGTTYYTASGACGGGSCSSGTYYDSTTCSSVTNTQNVVANSTTKYTGSGTCSGDGSGNCYKLTNGITYYTASGTCGGGSCSTGTYYDSATCTWYGGANSALNKTITLTKTATNLSTYGAITFWVRSNRTDSYLRFQMGESSSGEQYYEIPIIQANTWEQKTWNISGISSTARDAITKFAFKVTNADSAFTFYFDDIRASLDSTYLSPPIYAASFTSATDWGELRFNQTCTYGNIKYFILYDNSGTPTLIPDGTLPLNSTGFTASPVSLINLSTSTYPILYIKARLNYSGGSPRLNTWWIATGLPDMSKMLRHGKYYTGGVKKFYWWSR